MTDKEKLEKIKELADAMYYEAHSLSTNASVLHQAMEKYHQFVINEYRKEEPVSEDNNLRKASEKYLKVLSETPYNNTPITNAQTIVRELITFLDSPSKYNPNHIEEPVSEGLEKAIDTYLATYFGGDKEKQEWPFLKKMAIYFANWQKSKDAKLIINAKDDGYRLGLATMKQQMMAKAVDAVVKIDAGGYPYIDSTIELYDYDKDIPLAKRGDKYKVILIKED